VDRRWWLLLGAVPVGTACAVAAGDAALRPIGDVGVAVAGLTAFAVLWVAGNRHGRPSGWRLLAVAPLLPVVGAVLVAGVDPVEPLQQAVLRWTPTVPGYLLAILGLMRLVDRGRRRPGLRLGVEAALFLAACLVGVQLLVIGPDGAWSVLDLGERVVLGAAVVVTTATMATALTLLAIVEPHRRRMATVLLVGAVLLTAGRGLATSAVLSGAGALVDVSRFVVAGGLLLLALAVLLDPGCDAPPAGSRAGRRCADLGQLLPHAALFAAAAVAGLVVTTGHRISSATVAGLVLCTLLAAVHRWVTARDERRLGARLRRSEAYFRSLVRSGGDAVVILDEELRVSWASAALERALGPAAAELTGRPLREAVHPEDVATLDAVLPRSAAGGPAAGDGDPGLFLLRLRDAQGEWHYLEAGVSDLRADADVGAVVLHCRDMTDRHAREAALLGVAYTDPMTGLPNRAGYLQAVEETLAGAAGAAPTLLLVELEGLAAAREHSGREVVSLVVAEIGRRLRATVRGEDVVARIGGGAFAVLAQESDTDADQLAARCLAVVEQPIATPAGIVDLTASVGLVPLEPGLSVDDVLSRAELAVQEARGTGPGTAARYVAALGEAAARRDRLRADLAGASARGELYLLFQPIIGFDGGRITGAEALLRWRHPEFGDVPPTEFIPLAERAGLIGELQRWVLARAVDAAAATAGGDAAPAIGLNLPAGYVAGGTLVGDVQEALDRAGVPPQRLVVEITEDTVLADDERAALDVATLRLMGVHVALDGFGTGRSALGHLTALPIDILKLDRSLVSRIDRDPQSRALCESMIGIGHALGLAVVAEGVETPAQLGALGGLGADRAQGFAIARPMALAQFVEVLRAGAGTLRPGLVGTH
jgi:diguanylate cyclase (GGDEF)-like protein/PAS domain S-box-containing protein